MKALTIQPIDAKVENEIVEMLQSGAGLEEVVLKMRLSGLDKIDSIKLLRDHAHVSLAEAKKIVHLSPAWQNHLDSDNRLHDQAVEAARELGFTEVSQ